MKCNLPIPNDKKLMVIYRLESDCLGQVGNKQIHEFCHYVTKSVKPVDSDFVVWLLLPRLTPNEHEIEYRVDGKLMTYEQVVKYLAVFNREYSIFEESLNEAVLKQIDRYFS
jgi:hypothetical protein